MPVIVRESFPERPAFDIAVSHALLRRVASGEVGPTVRLYRPGATLAFGKLDRLEAGYEDARAAARAHGFEPVLRIAGGRAAAYDEGSLVYEEIVPTAGLGVGVRERFDAVTEMLADVLVGLGVDARVGALPGEYCAGAHSVNVAGRVKVVGVAQRAIRGAALVSAVVVVEGGARVRSALVDVYAALGLGWEPSTAGAISDRHPDVGISRVESAIGAALAAAGEVAQGTIDVGTRALAEELARAS